MSVWTVQPSSSGQKKERTFSRPSFQGRLTVEQLLLLVALGLVFPGAATWGIVKAGRLWASLWAPWLFSSLAHGWLGSRMVSP